MEHMSRSANSDIVSNSYRGGVTQITTYSYNILDV